MQTAADKKIKTLFCPSLYRRNEYSICRLIFGHYFLGTTPLFNLIMLSVDWTVGQATVHAGRVFEYTEDDVAEGYQNDGAPNLELLRRLPCLFMQEGTGDQVARVGLITDIRRIGQDIAFSYTFDNDVPPLTNALIYQNRLSVDMPHDFEFSRNHWAVKNVDLYKFLLRTIRPRRQRPTVFEIPEHERIEPTLVSAMMPFSAEFTPVYDTIQAAAAEVDLRCRRADDIWENPAIIQDVVSLIDRSRIVVCDCTGRNPNVFYEAGIAHTLGREVILITQNGGDIPFDLRHLRYIPYLNNAEGRTGLATALTGRMQTLLGH